MNMEAGMAQFDAVTIGLGRGEAAEKVKKALLRGLQAWPAFADPDESGEWAVGQATSLGAAGQGAGQATGQADDRGTGQDSGPNLNRAEERLAGEEAFLLLRGLQGSWRENLADLIAQVILTEKETEILEKMLCEEGNQFTQEERETVLQQAQAYLNSDGISQIERRGRIQQIVADYWCGDSDLSLDGLVTFRLGEYQEELREAIERSVDDFLLEKEYNDFIAFLRLFIEAQTPRLEKVNVVFNEIGSPVLLDGAGKPIRSRGLGQLVAEMAEAKVSCDDLVLSALISLAPRRVVLHGVDQSEEGETARIIRRVFEARLDACDGCFLCAREPGLEFLSDRKAEDSPGAH